MDTTIDLFPELGKGEKLPTSPLVRPVEGHLWTAQKSLLIAEYVHRFLLVTHHGVYIDLFAGPQGETFTDDWSVKRILELRSEGNPSIGRYAVCDKNRRQVERLRELKALHDHKAHEFKIYSGDANKKIHAMLSEAGIGPRTATFCLIDQRTLECHWDTVRTVAEHKEGYKIEIFYFLAQAWIDRAMKSTRNFGRLERWWGDENYHRFINLKSVERAWALCEKFEDLGYTYVYPFSIHESDAQSKTMYYMIHASDHPKAQSLMAQAYNKVKGATPVGEQQEFRLE